MNIDKDGKLDIPKCTCNFPAETAREIGHYKDCPRTREKTWWQEKRELNMTTERVKEIMDLFLSKVRKPVSQEQIEWELDFRTHLLYELERMREIIRCERDAEVREKYNELIMAVSMKRDGETRHETALRYIKQVERGSDEAVKETKSTT